MKPPEVTTQPGDPIKRRRGYTALMNVGTPSLLPPVTTRYHGG